MNVLILHRIPYAKIAYHRGIDHNNHFVVYCGLEENLEDIPRWLKCEKWARAGDQNIVTETVKLIKQSMISFDCVLSMSEYELLDAANIRHLLNITGSSVEDVKGFRDKLVMKQKVALNGLAVPLNYSLSDIMRNESLRIENHVILKPVDGASSQNVQRYESIEQLRAAVLKSQSKIKEIDRGDYVGFEVEAYIEGRVLHFDGLIYGGNLELVVANRYIGNCLDYANGKALGSIQIELLEEHKTWVRNVLNAVNLRNGSFHLEAILQEDANLIFLEVANRVGGADVVNVVEYATGVHMPSVELSIYLGKYQKVTWSENKNAKFGWFVFPGHHLKSGYGRVIIEENIRNSAFILSWNQLNNPFKKLNNNAMFNFLNSQLLKLYG